MGKLRQKPIIFQAPTNVSLENGRIKMAGPKGDLQIDIPAKIDAQLEPSKVKLTVADEKDNPLLGLYNSLIRNAISGVSSGWQKTLELVGVGFRAQGTGSELILNVGFSHPVKITAPPGVTFQVSENKIIVSGADKYLVGETAASVRRVKPPEPYKGKGIRYLNEVIRKKLGKAAKAVGAASAAK